MRQERENHPTRPRCRAGDGSETTQYTMTEAPIPQRCNVSAVSIQHTRDAEVAALLGPSALPAQHWVELPTRGAAIRPSSKRSPAALVRERTAGPVRESGSAGMPRPISRRIDVPLRRGTTVQVLHRMMYSDEDARRRQSVDRSLVRRVGTYARPYRTMLIGFITTIVLESVRASSTTSAPNCSITCSAFHCRSSPGPKPAPSSAASTTT